MTLIIAMDGPSGAGKSSTSKGLAIRGNWSYLDTGALYRAVTLIAQQNGIDDETALREKLRDYKIEFETNPKDPKIKINGENVNNQIRTESITANVSKISAWKSIRELLYKLQREIITNSLNGIVVEGRDIGTVVAPEAALKIFLEADLRQRSLRRATEMSASSSIERSSEEVAEMLNKRDEIDSNRTLSPLTKAEDAVVVDSTFLNLEETIDYIWNILSQRSLLGLPTVVVIGRPNVGKSTLVNRIIGSREAIIEDKPGVTRDRVRYEAEWNGKRFIIVDTGGWEPSGEGITMKIAAAAESAIADADLILFVIDGKVGTQSEDEALVSLLRKSQKKIMLIANKIDSERDEIDAHSLWNIGLGEPYFVSAAHGRGSGDLLDLIVANLPEVGQSLVNDSNRRIAIVGRPNVGKSSLLNSFAGEVRSLVDDAEGTTRDPIDELITIDGRTWRFIDTAGIRKRANQTEGVDYYAAIRTERAIDNTEVAIVVLDASKTITEQDLRIISLVEDAGKALVIGMNKWDLVDEERRLQLDKEMDRNLDQVEWAERVNISAKTGWHRDRLMPAVIRALRSWEFRIPTGKLNSFLGQLVGANPPPVRGGRQPKILFATQAGIEPPTFIVFATDFIEPSYRRFIERRLREEFGFTGTPIRVSVRIRER
jgi:GTP-binding protein